MKTDGQSNCACPECGSEKLRVKNITFKLTHYYWWVCCKCGQSPEAGYGAERTVSVCELHERLWHVRDGELRQMGGFFFGPPLKDVHVVKAEPVLHCPCRKGMDMLWEEPGNGDNEVWCWDSFWVVQCRNCGHWLRHGWEGDGGEQLTIPDAYPHMDQVELHPEPVCRKVWWRTFGVVRKKGGLWLPTVAIETYPKRMKK